MDGRQFADVVLKRPRTFGTGVQRMRLGDDLGLASDNDNDG